MALAEEQRDEALNRVQMLTEKFDQLNSQNGSNMPRGDLRGLSLQKLKGLQVFFFIQFYIHCLRFIHLKKISVLRITNVCGHDFVPSAK